ncbi:uncharacterized protein TNCV_984471 [Trichonephila clavipes]|nr:uncharacterized protein TNCV_984471 [Trichonephila clavipes]
MGIQYVKTVVYRPQSNRTESVNHYLLQMIASYASDNSENWEQCLREFAYALRAAVNETTGKTPAEVFLGRKLITPFQKLVMLSDGTEFAIGDIEKLFEEARKNTKVKHEKWAKYYNRRSSSSEYQASSFESVRPISDWAQNSKNSESGEQHGVQGKMTGLKEDQGDRRKTGNDKRKRNVGSKESSLQISSWIKKSRKKVMGYKRSIHTSR